MSTPPPTHQINPQRGAALIVSLAMLVAITIIGISVMSNSHLEWLMASNSRFQSDAFMQAEATLMHAEAAIPSDPAAISWGDPFYRDDLPSANPNALPADPNQAPNWGSYMASASAGIGAPAGTENKYVIDYLGCNIQVLGNSLSGCGGIGNISIFTYRVWSRSTNDKGSARILQSSYTITLSAGLVPTRRRIGFAQVSR